MRKEHKYHVIVILIMMLAILAIFSFVILNKPAGTGITTSLPSMVGEPIPANQIPNREADNSNLVHLESIILIGFLIILALLFIWYVGIKIAKELRNH